MVQGSVNCEGSDGDGEAATRARITEKRRESNEGLWPICPAFFFEWKVTLYTWYLALYPVRHLALQPLPCTLRYLALHPTPLFWCGPK